MLMNPKYHELKDVDDEDDSNVRIARQHLTNTHWTYRLIIAALLVSNTLFAAALYRKTTTRQCERSLVYSPASISLPHEKRRLWRNIDDNVYAGKPRKEHDEAWRQLIEPITIKISEYELHLINETSIAMLDGSGYIAETAVYHELHCIKRIRRHLYLDHYYPNMTEDQRRREGPHIDHCLEYWREAAMCRGDTTLSTFQWAEGRPFSHVYSDHDCVNWDALDTWARGRMVSMTDLSILAGHP